LKKRKRRFNDPVEHAGRKVQVDVTDLGDVAEPIEAAVKTQVLDEDTDSWRSSFLDEEPNGDDSESSEDNDDGGKGRETDTMRSPGRYSDMAATTCELTTQTI
jgi:hypothetical protein